MSLQDIEEGRYPATIKNYALKSNEHLGKVECLIQMEFQSGSQKHFITWKGLFTTKDGVPSKKTISTLLTCGFKGNDPTVLAEGPDGKHLDMERQYDVTLERNEGGYLEVAWINEPGGILFNDILSKKDAINEMKGTNIGGAFMKARQEEGGSDSKSDDFGPEPSLDTNDEIPF